MKTVHQVTTLSTNLKKICFLITWYFTDILKYADSEYQLSLSRKDFERFLKYFLSLS